MKKMPILFALVCLSLSTLSKVALAESGPIRRAILEQVEAIPNPGSYDLEVYARSSTVILDGSVSTEAMRQKIEQIARSTEGVLVVQNNLKVGSSGACVPLVAEQMARIQKDLDQKIRAGEYEMQLQNEGGTLTITGRARRLEISDQIETVVRSHAGDQRVSNQLQIGMKPVADASLKEQITRALRSNPEVSMDDLEFQVEQGVVTFRGTRPRHEDVDRILSVALMVDGVLDVKSEMKIEGH